jgi:hypothetical protein
MKRAERLASPALRLLQIADFRKCELAGCQQASETAASEPVEILVREISRAFRATSEKTGHGGTPGIGDAAGPSRQSGIASRHGRRRSIAMAAGAMASAD